MNDLDKLREAIREIELPHKDAGSLACTVEHYWPTIRAALDAVPPETLAEIKAGTWKVVPVKPTNVMLLAGDIGLVGYDNLRGKGVYRAMLSAAPTKPED